MKISKLIALSLLGMTIHVSGVLAEPVAPIAQLNDSGKAMLELQGKTEKDLVNSIPSKEGVGVPIYPGAMFLSALSGSEGMLPGLNLVSEEPLEKVKMWYEKHLEGWSYSDMMMLYHEGTGKLSFADAMKTPTVNVIALEPDAFDLMIFDVPNGKTRIQITYRPAGK